MKVLVTGANGLLGRHVTSAICTRHEVHALVQNLSENCNSGVIYHQVDFAGQWSCASLPSKIDAVIHLAQSSHFREFPEQALDMIYVNVVSTARLLDYARSSGAKKFIFASSGGVYGSGVGVSHEDAQIAGNRKLGYYLSTKLCSEVLMQNYAHLMEICTLRIFFMYGFGQRRSMLIPRLVDTIREGRPVSLQGKDGIRINPVHVSDAVATLEACLAHTGELTVNVAGPEVLTLRRVAEIIGTYLKKEPSFEWVDGEPSDFVGNITLMMSMLGRPLMTFQKGVADVL